MGQIDKTAAELNSMLTDMDGTVDTNFRIKDGVFQIRDMSGGATPWKTAWIDGGSMMIAQNGEA